MTLADLITLTNTYLDDLNSGYFTTSQVTRFLNNAQYEVQKHLIGAGENWYMRCQETTLVLNQKEYVLPQDFLKVNRLELQMDSNVDNNAQIYPITPNQIEFFTTQPSDPRGYYIKKNKLILAPTPNSTKTLRLYYTYLVTEMTELTQEPDVPTQYHEYLAVLAARDGLIKDGRDPSTLLNKLETYKQLLKQDADERTIDEGRHVVITEDYQAGGVF